MGYSKHEFSCIPIADAENNTGSVRVRVTLKYKQFFVQFHFFAMKTGKNGRQKVLSSVIVSLLWGA